MKTYLALFLVATSGCVSSDSTCEVDTVATWRELSTSDAPRSQKDFAGVWTGTELLIWGGESEFFADDALATGSRFDPDTNKWTPMSEAGAPEGRRNAASVWTGTEMIVWGGENESGDLATGARYNPALDRWTPMSNVGAPDRRSDALAVWTGTEMLVVGGWYAWTYSLRLVDGALYNPASDTWRPVARHDGGTRSAIEAGAAWTGREVVFWGGHHRSSEQEGYDRGWAFDPAAGSWRVMSTRSQPSMRSPEVMTTLPDGKVLVWGSDELYQTRSDGGVYDPVTDTWLLLPLLANIGDNRPALFTGDSVIVGPDSNVPGSYGWLVDPFTGEVTPLPALAKRDLWSPLAWTGSEAIVWMTFAEPTSGQLGGRLQLCQ